MMRWTLRFHVFAILGAALASGCSDPNTYVAPPPPEVTVSPPLQKTVTEYLEFTGRTVAVAEVEIRARVQGYLQKMHVEEGDIVKEKDLLFTIDPREYEASRKEAAAAVEVATTALELAEATFKRVSQAVEKKAVSVIEGLESKAKRDQAVATLKQRQAELETTELKLSYTKIHAPIPGRVGAKLVHEGNLVGASDATLLTTVVQYDPIYAVFDINEREILGLMGREDLKRAASEEERLANLRKIPVELGLSDDPGYPIKGNMHFTEHGVDVGTGTMLIRAIFPNPYPPNVLPGLFVHLRSPFAQREDALLVPEIALGSDQSGRYVLVVDEQDVVQHRRVVPGEKVDNMTVILSGLEPKDRVIINGLLRARPGAKVTPLPPVADADSKKKESEEKTPEKQDPEKKTPGKDNQGQTS